MTDSKSFCQMKNVCTEKKRVVQITQDYNLLYELQSSFLQFTFLYNLPL